MRSRAPSTVTVVTQLTQGIGPNNAIAPMIVPPDGGWGWVVVMVGLLGSCVVDGCVYCFYMFREPMSKDLNIPQAEISYLSSINTGFYFIGAVFACSFGNFWGFRATMVIGSVLTSLSYASGYLLQEMYHYYLSVGILGGIGSGFVSVGGGLPASFYFDKKRAIALGIVSSGSGFGGLIMPHLIKLFMKHYGWRATYLFQGGIMALGVFMGLLIRPLKPVMVVINPISSQTLLRTGDDSITDLSVFRIPPPPPTGPSDAYSIVSFPKSPSLVMDMPSTTQPTIIQMAEDSNVINIRVREDTDPSIITRLHEMAQSRRQSRLLQPSASNVFNSINIMAEPGVLCRRPWYKCGCCRSKYISFPERPLMRKDLYYTGSLYRLPEYTTKDKDLEYHMDVTRVPTYYETIQDLTNTYTTWCCKNICNGLRNLIDYTMFKSVAFICLAFCGFCIYIAFYLPYLFCKVHLEQVNLGDYDSSMISIMSLGSTTGRLFSGLIITSFPRFNARTFTSVMLFTSSISIMAVVQLDNLYYKAMCLFIYGYSIACYVPLRSIIIVDYFGLKKLTAASGVLILCLGLGSFAGPPIAEQFIIYSKSKNAPYYVCGISLFLASISLWPMKRLNSWQTKRAARKKEQRSHRRRNS